MNKWLYSVHGWLGLNCGLILLIICFSGSLAVVSHEIDWLLNPVVRASHSQSTTDWAAIEASVRREYPGRAIASIMAPQGSGFAAEVWLQDSAFRTRIYVHPNTGKVSGEAPWFNCQRFFRDFHRRFFWYSSWGITLVSLFAVLLLLSVFSGLLFYKRWWTKLFRLRVYLGWRVVTSDLHRLSGLWTLLFALLIGLTGVFYLLERPLTNLVRESIPRAPTVSPKGRLQLAAHIRLIDTAALLRTAEEHDPDFRVKLIRFPQRAGDPVILQGQAAAWFVRERANLLHIDPETGRVKYHQRAETLTPLVRLIDTVDPLHFGNFGGLTSKLVWLLFGLLLSIMMPTGVFLWVRRMEQATLGVLKRVANSANTAPLARLRVQTRWWSVVGLFTTTAIMILAVYSTLTAVVDQLPADPTTELAFAETNCGPWTVLPTLSTASESEQEATMQVRFCADNRALPNFRSVAIAVSQVEPSDEQWQAAKGGNYAVSKRLSRSEAEQLRHGHQRLWLRIESTDRKVHNASTDLQPARTQPPALKHALQSHPWRVKWGVWIVCGGFLLLCAAAASLWFGWILRVALGKPAEDTLNR